MDVPQADGLRPARFETREQTHAFDTNLQKELLLEYNRDSKNKSQEYSKFLADKKALITIIFRQCDDSSSSSSDYAQFVLAVTTVAYHTVPINKS